MRRREARGGGGLAAVKERVRDTVFFVVFLALISAAMFALVFFGMR